MSHQAFLRCTGIIPTLILLLLLQVWSGCAKVAQRDASMTLDSRYDKKSETGFATPSKEDGWNHPSLAAEGTAAISYSDQMEESGTNLKQAVRTGAETSSVANALAGFPNMDTWLLPTAYAQENPLNEKYLIRSGNLELKLDNLDDGQAAALLTAGKFGGTVTNTAIRKDSSGYRSGTITIRIPSDKFMPAWSELLRIKGAEVISQNIETQDVGSEYISAVSRMKALTKEQETLQKMLDEALAVQRSRGLGEAYKVLLDTQSRLSEVTAEIQGVEDRVKALADQITRSTITLSLTENPKIPVAAPDVFNWGLGATFNSAVRDLMENLRSFAQGAIYFFVTLQWIWWLLFFFIARFVWRRYHKVMASAASGTRPPTAPRPPAPAD